MLLVAHELSVVRHMSDRVAVMYLGRIVELGTVEGIFVRPQHPYSAGLMGSIPSIVDERDRLTQIDGSMPRLTAMPSGCAFHPRCRNAGDSRRVDPRWCPSAPGHLVACHFPG
jgi:peptide/nickel transport system ATP-binding protein